MGCCVCILTSHRTECLPVHFCGGTPLQYSSGFQPCCNGSRLCSSRRQWDRIRPWYLLGARSFWTYALCFDCQGGSSMGSGVRCHSSCGEWLGESMRLAWSQSRYCLRCRIWSCILSLRCSSPLCGQRACLIWPPWRGWLPARCCQGCYPLLLQVELLPRGTKRKPVIRRLSQQRHIYLTC